MPLMFQTKWNVQEWLTLHKFTRNTTPWFRFPSLVAVIVAVLTSRLTLFTGTAKGLSRGDVRAGLVSRSNYDTLYGSGISFLNERLQVCEPTLVQTALVKPQEQQTGHA